MTERLRVLFAIPNLSRGGSSEVQGGPEGVFVSLLREIDTGLFEPFLVVDSAEASNLIETLPTSVSVLSLAHDGRPLHPTVRPLRRYPVPELAQVVRVTKPHVVLATQRMNWTSALAKVLFPPGSALVCRVANNLSGALETQGHLSGRTKVAAIAGLHRFVLQRADLIVAQSTSMCRDLTRRFGRHIDSKTVTIPNPVDVAGLRSRANDPAVVVPARRSPQLVSVGRLHRQKGYDLLLPAFAKILRRWPDAGLWLIGEGPDRTLLEALAVELAIDGRVQFVGFVGNPAPYLRQADLYICSSRYEGFPNALGEALAVGTPAVAPVGPAAGDDLLTHDTGVLIPASTIDALADGISIALTRRDFDREAISASCEERFSAGRVTRRYEDTLRQAAGMPRRPNPGSIPAICPDGQGGLA